MRGTIFQSIPGGKRAFALRRKRRQILQMIALARLVMLVVMGCLYDFMLRATHLSEKSSLERLRETAQQAASAMHGRLESEQQTIEAAAALLSAGSQTARAMAVHLSRRIEEITTFAQVLFTNAHGQGYRAGAPFTDLSGYAFFAEAMAEKAASPRCAGRAALRVPLRAH